MKTFLVSWEIHIHAATAHEAAQQAHDLVRRPDTMATVYQVIEHDSGGDCQIVDLNEVLNGQHR
ncbi:hypothetical protein [Pseudochrobactrum asaccharolyticum]|uniref:Uncharacterized protein n=1 Tax=Pseudochrobactrum asaccharolyticum TaxID=354351 RepID=A0A366DKC9_9HYPH|nr:hypothetical protein [Pseudochrobactrum asaccharolyticum]RBO90481.1 hypothetical protein DFR47_11342 [Pseudochrobactrum asaccharolyticum]